MAAPFPLAGPPAPDEPRNGPRDNPRQKANSLDGGPLTQEDIAVLLDFFQLLDEWDQQGKS
jgi:hypothetical protein